MLTYQSISICQVNIKKVSEMFSKAMDCKDRSNLTNLYIEQITNNLLTSKKFQSAKVLVNPI